MWMGARSDIRVVQSMLSSVLLTLKVVCWKHLEINMLVFHFLFLPNTNEW
jgi:hypothetical protein